MNSERPKGNLTHIFPPTYLSDQYFANKELAIEIVDFPRLPFPLNSSGSKLNYCFLVY